MIWPAMPCDTAFAQNHARMLISIYLYSMYFYLLVALRVASITNLPGSMSNRPGRNKTVLSRSPVPPLRFSL